MTPYLPYLYILDADGNPVPEPDIEVWGAWMFKTDNKRIAIDELDGIEISTVFLGIDHGFGFSGNPILFETMVFDDYGDTRIDLLGQRRYATRSEALAGHQRIVTLARTLTATAKGEAR